MADILKLKKKAAEFEAKKQPDKALTTYREIVDAYEAGDDDPIDIPLYNRVGDMLQKAGNLPDAVSVWEKAVDHYTEGGFYNPAIALCNKILRASPGRTVIYYKLGKISAEKGFKADARQNFLEYASRQQKAGNLDDAFKALKEFADLVSGQHDVRLMLADQLLKAERKDEALEQLQLGYVQATTAGDASAGDQFVAKMKEIDPSVEPRADAGGGAGGGGGLVFLDVDTPGGGAPKPKRPVVDVKRMSKAVAGLDLLEPVRLDPPPAPRAPTPSRTVTPIPAPPVAPAMPAAASANALDIVSTDMGAGTAPPPRTSMIGLEVTNLGDEPETPAEPTSDLPMIDLDESPAAERPAAASVEPMVEPMVELEPAFDAPSQAPLVELEPSLVESESSRGELEPPLVEMEPSLTRAEGATESKMMTDDSASGGGDLPMLEAEPSASVELPMLDVGQEAPAESPAEALVEAVSEAVSEAVAEGASDVLVDEMSTELASTADALRERVAAAAEDWALRRQFAEALLEGSERAEGMKELEVAMAGYERAGDLDTAGSIAEEIVRLEPKSIRFHQKRVEFAFRANDRGRLAEAYVELADALLADGQAAKARTVYQRVLDIRPDDLRAQAAVESIPAEVEAPPPPARRSTTAAPKPAAAAKPAAASKGDADDEFVSLGDWLREDDEPKSTRMVVEEKEPTGDEQADFNDMLRKFKKGVSDNVDDEDHEAHYDLGVAYKEMGLLDEAIAEFQKALRGTNERVRTFEALGHCFIEKKQPQVAATILTRSLTEPGVRDESLIGVLYLLGTIAEQLGGFADAKKHYERVFAVDIQFRDIGDRLNAVEQRLG